MMKRSLFVLAVALAGCAGGGSTTQPTGPTEVLNVGLQPARLTPDPQGAMALSAVTGCFVQFVGRGSADLVWQFRVGPTARVPTMDACLASLRTQPGVTSVEIAR
jgi:hypothetical protein